MRKINIRYLTREGIRNIGINRLMTVASVAVLLSCLVIIGSAVMLFLNVDSLLKTVESQNVIMAFCDVNAKENEVALAGEKINQIDNVYLCEFVSKAQAYGSIAETLGEDAAILYNIDDSFLPDGFKITVADMKYFSETVEKIKAIQSIASVRQNSELAEKFEEIRSAVSYISLGIILILFIVSMFIIANTVRITMFSRKLEISIMKAVGATNWFIRWPFLVEGVFIGFISSILSFVVLGAMYNFLSASLATVFNILGNSVVSFWKYALPIFCGFVFIGVMTGGLGSMISIKKYLKEQGSVVLNDE